MQEQVAGMENAGVERSYLA